MRRCKCILSHTSIAHENPRSCKQRSDDSFAAQMVDPTSGQHTLALLHPSSLQTMLRLPFQPGHEITAAQAGLLPTLELDAASLAVHSAEQDDNSWAGLQAGHRAASQQHAPSACRDDSGNRHGDIVGWPQVRACHASEHPLDATSIGQGLARSTSSLECTPACASDPWCLLAVTSMRAGRGRRHVWRCKSRMVAAGGRPAKLAHDLPRASARGVECALPGEADWRRRRGR